MKVTHLLTSLLIVGSLAAHPQGFQLAAGDASPPIVDAQGNMVIQSGSKAIVNWDTFSIAAAEQIHFQQQGSSSAILNRVTGSQGSDLLGLLSSNGRVLLINPNGVFIGQAGRIETADFLVSTFDVFDADFLQEKELLFCGDSGKSIQNLGTISCPKGNIHLFAAHVVNEGALQASQGKVLLAAGGDILLQKDGYSHIYIRPELTQEEIEGAAIDNKGSIEAMVASLQAGDSPYAKAIRCSGTINATTVQKVGREVYLVAQKGITEIDGGALTASGGIVHVLGEKVGLQNDSRIDVSSPSGGGTILIGGDLQGQNPEIQNATVTYVSKDSEIRADALENGDGGKVIIWSDEMTVAYGNISTRGGEEGGDGGFVEVSGKYLDFQGLADRRAPQGNFGMLLLDPVNITIDDTPDSVNITNPNLSVMGSSGEYLLTACGPSPANINASTSMSPNSLEQNLNIGFVTISTSAPVANTCLVDVGTITVSSAVSWNAATTLTLIADANIIINQPITNTNTVSPPFPAMAFTANGTGSTVDGIAVAAILSCSGAGGITLTGMGGSGVGNANGVHITSHISTQGSIAISGLGGMSSGGAAQTSGVQISSFLAAGVAGSTASITLTGTAGNGVAQNSGVEVDAAVTLLGTGSINFNNCLGNFTSNPNGSYGVRLLGISCTASNGTINFSNCQGGTATLGNNIGVNLENCTCSAATINFSSCIGGSTGPGNCFGIFVDNSTISAVNNITATNIQSSNGASNPFAILGSSATIRSTSGNIAITASSSGTGGVGLFFSAGTPNLIQAGGSGTITLNGTGQTNGITLENTSITSVNGNISLIGTVEVGGGILSSIASTGTGSVSFSSTIDGVSGSSAPLTINAGGSVTVAGAIGSNTPLTSLTIQPGSGSSTSPTLGTIPNGRVIFGGSSVITTGAITLSATGRTQPMSIATIIGTGNLAISSSSLTMGVDESMTVLGNLSISVTGPLSISDIVAAGTLVLSGSSITLNSQPSVKYLSKDGTFYTSPDAHIFALTPPVVSPAISSVGPFRVLAAKFPSEAAFASVLVLNSTVLNYDTHGLSSVEIAAVNQFGVANSQVVANGPWGLLPILDLRFFPIYAFCYEITENNPCTTGVFVPFIFESDIIDGNIFRSL